MNLLPLVHVVVLSDDPDLGASMARWFDDQPLHRVVAAETVESRTGEGAQSLYQRCFRDSDCWKLLRATTGADRLVLAESLKPPELGIRIADLDHGTVMQRTVTWAPPTNPGLRELVHGDATIEVHGVPAGGWVRLDGNLVDSALVLVKSGKHTVEVGAPDLRPSFGVVLVHPGAAAQYEAPTLQPHPKMREAKSATGWVALGVAGTGALLVGLAGSGGRAARP